MFSPVFLSLLLALTFPLLGSALWADDLAAPVFDVPLMKGIKVDGKRQDWADGGFRVDLLCPPGSRPLPAQDHDPRFRLGWNDEGLLVLIRVGDDHWIEHAREDWLWRYDSIELFLAPRPGAADWCQWVIAPGMAPAKPSLRWHHHDHRSTKELKELSSKIKVARTKSAEGYLCEALLPWSCLGIDAGIGREVGFQIVVNDADEKDGATSHAAWFPAGDTSANSASCHRLRLSHAPGDRIAHLGRTRYDWAAGHRIVETIVVPEFAGKRVEVRREGRVVAEGLAEKDASGRAFARILVEEEAFSGIADDYRVRLDGTASARPLPEGLKDFSARQEITDLTQRWVFSRLYRGHDDTRKLFVGAVDEALNHILKTGEHKEDLPFIRACGIRKARNLWPHQVLLEPAEKGFAVRIRRWLSSWTGSTGYEEAPLLDDTRPTEGKVVLKILDSSSGKVLHRGSPIAFRCIRGKTKVNPRWREEAQVEVPSPLLKPLRLEKGRRYEAFAVALSADGKELGEERLLVDHLLRRPDDSGKDEPTDAAGAKALGATVEMEQEVYRYSPFDNGSTPMWCHGGTCVVRAGKNVVLSGVVNAPNSSPPWNTQWVLFQGDGGKLKKVADGGSLREREPCPMVCLPKEGAAFLSVNSIDPSSDDSRDMEVLRVPFAGKARSYEKPAVLVPEWSKPHEVAPHTYRSIVADGERSEILMFTLDYRTPIGWEEMMWSFYGKGKWLAKGVVKFPQVRVTYPAVHLKDRAVYLVGSTDPVPGGSIRDYQQMFFTWSDDVTTGKFHDWVELVNREKTGGYVHSLDLRFVEDSRGKRAHVVWYDRLLSLDRSFQMKYAPGLRQRISLNHSIIKDGKMVSTRPIVLGYGDGEGEIPSRVARFHSTPDGRLLVLHHVTDPHYEMRVAEVFADGSVGPSARIPLKRSMPAFFSSGQRFGCEPSWVADVLGDTRRQGYLGGTFRYARIRFNP